MMVFNLYPHRLFSIERRAIRSRIVIVIRRRGDRFADVGNSDGIWFDFSEAWKEAA
jgi:hypothetical protein